MPADNARLLPFPSPSQASLAGFLLQGPSPAIARLWSQMGRVAPHFRAVLLIGETGSGLEAAARGLHALSPVSALRFRVLDALHAEADLTTARAPALSGFLYFSQIEQMSLPAQRNLQRRLRQRDNSLRVAAGVTGELRAAVGAGRFDTLLAESLSAVRVTVPPLRERKDDLRMLTEAMLARCGDNANVGEDFYAAACAFAWPGNFPQMRDVMAAARKAAKGALLCAQHFETACSETQLAAPAPAAPAVRMIKLDEVLNDHVRAVLMGCGGNKLRAAEILGISRSTLYRLLDAASVAAPLAKAS